MNDRVLIAGTGSGCGKTTVTLALLSALQERGVKTVSFKCGPDYIDPMFHRRVLGQPARNLDPFFCSAPELRALAARGQGAFSVIEGVMGYYDGVGPEGAYSTCAVAEATGTPVILTVSAAGMSNSAGALLRGFRTYRAGNGIRGVIFNNISAAAYERLRPVALAEGLVPLGFLPHETELSLGSRHLGLITADEIGNLREILRRLGRLAEEYLDLDAVLALGAEAAPLAPPPAVTPRAAEERPRPVIAVARDEAFCFLYQDNLELLSALGCEIRFFSPLRDRQLPAGTCGLYLPGGYPELYAGELSANADLRAAVRSAADSGLPLIAECGGFLYLHASLDGYPLAGVIPAAAETTKKLQSFGYVTLTAQKDSLLCRAGEHIRAHEFHYCSSALPGSDFLAEKPQHGKTWFCVHATERMYAGFPHLYLPSNPAFAENFVGKAIEYAAEKHS